jgi:hypothetical protein
MARIVFGAVSPVPRSSDSPGIEPRPFSGTPTPLPFSIEVEGAADAVISALNSAGGGWAPLMMVQQRGEPVRVYVNPAQILFVRD